MTITAGLEAIEVDEAQLRAICLAELRSQGLVLPAAEEELLVALCASAYREDVVRALHGSTEVGAGA
ncbi:MAG: hypothetical protein JWN08_154 [Frankiales bacterium]|jgi:hypothetical protein|nr:hypothetical protein [Frankiales bacterium]